jgi:MFS family permease
VTAQHRVRREAARLEEPRRPEPLVDPHLIHVLIVIQLVPLRRVQLLFGLVGASDAALLPFLPIVLKNRGLSAAQIGVVLSLAAAASFFAMPMWGHAADRLLGPERTIAIAAVAASVAIVPLALAHSLVGIAVATVAVTASRSALGGLSDALALDHLGRDARGDYGRVRLWQSIGWAVAACVWGALLQTTSLDLLPAIYIPSVLALALAAASIGGTVAVRERAEVGSRRRMVRALAPFLVSLLLLFSAFSATFAFVSVRIADLGGGLFIVGLATALQAVAEAPVMRATPWLGRMLSHRAMYVAGCLFFAIAFAAWAFLDSSIAIALVKLVAGIGFGLAYVGSVVIVDDLVPPTLRGTAQSLARAVSFGLAAIVGSLAGGAIYDYAGPRALFLACAASALLAGAGVWVVAARGVRLPSAAWTPRS